MEPVSEDAARRARAVRSTALRMSGPGFKFDEVGEWSIIKLNILEQYGAAYTTAFSGNSGRGLKKYYIDGFSGAGQHIERATGKPVEGSPARALKITPPFDKFFFIDLDRNKTDYLETQCAGRSNVSIINDDANVYLRKLLPKIRFDQRERALCVLDPYKLNLDWDVIELAGKSRVVDLFLNFPVMDMNRNAIWREPERAPAEGIERMNRFWGDESWRQAAYAKSRQGEMFSDPQDEKQKNSAIVAAFTERLKSVAGFAYVANRPMVNSKNADVYYLFFASQKPVADKIITGVFKKHR
jgi:three-Cys-motif partner protein